VASQAFAALATAIALPWIVAATRRAIPPGSEPGPQGVRPRRVTAVNEGVAVLARRALGRALRYQREALEAALQLGRTGDRRHGTDSEHKLADARGEVEEIFPQILGAEPKGREVDMLRRAALATLQLQRSVEDLLRLAERGLERHLLLGAAAEQTVRPIHRLVTDGMVELADGIERGETPDVEQARAREIRLNALECGGRQEAITNGVAVAARLRLTELLDAYENVGNHLYRVYESTTTDVDDAVA
jgi:hypothetical protein